MMQINSGLLLRKPGESAYAAARRFIIANPSLNYKTLVAEACQRKYSHTDHSHCFSLSLIFQLAHQTEVEHCERFDIVPPQYSMKPPAPFAANPWAAKISRNCPACAETIYHSPFYELPWLAECPIHHRLLTNCCPDCGNSWPAISDLWKRFCDCCGARIERDALRRASIASLSWDLSSLNLLERAIGKSLEWKDTVIRTKGWDSNDAGENCCRISLSPRNYFFPSIISSFNLEFRQFCRRQKIHIERCLHLRFICQPHESDEAHNNSAIEKAWMSRCKNEIREKIKAAIVSSAGPKHQLMRRHTHFYRGGGIHHCAYCMAFNFWCDLMEEEPENSAFNLSWMLTLRALPLPPKPMHILVRKSFRTLNPSDPSKTTETKSKLPEDARYFLYSLDLWTTFVTLFHHVEYSLKIIEESVSERQRNGYLEAAVKHNEFISRSIAFWRSRGDELIICIPKSIISPQINAVFAEHWPEICSSKKSKKKNTTKKIFV